MVGLMKWMSGNVRYPKKAMDKNVAGKVLVSFVVDEKGNVKDVAIKQGAHPDFNAEALRVVRAMPKWKPGMDEGKPVAVSMTLPIRFDLAPPPPPKPEKEAR